MEHAYKLAAGRVWFADDRTPPRRMQVTHHPEHGLVVLSLWHGDVCAGTFRLPLVDAPELIGVLVTALADAAGQEGSNARPRADEERVTPRWIETTVRAARRLRERLVRG